MGKKSFSLRSVLTTFTVIMISISGLTAVMALSFSLKEASSLVDVLRLLFLYFIMTMIVSPILEILKTMLKTVFVKWIGIAAYIFVFAWQLSLLLMF